LQEGVDRAYDWLTGRVREFARCTQALRGELQRIGARRADAEVARYVEGLELLLGGHLAWNSEDNPRYTDFVGSRSEG
jgi:hypothetical protein